MEANVSGKGGIEIRGAELKRKIEEGLDHLDTFYGSETTKDLRIILERTNKDSALFEMYQTFREFLSEETDFLVEMKDGTIKKFKTLKEARDAQ